MLITNSFNGVYEGLIVYSTDYLHNNYVELVNE